MRSEQAAQTPPAGAAKGSARRDYSYYRDIFQGRRMPFAFLDLDLLQDNIQLTLARAKDKKIRLATKSLRSVSVIRRILAASPQFQGLMCFTAREAIYLASLGFTDLLVGYPCYGERDIEEVAQAVASGASITLMVDSIAHIERVNAVAERIGTKIPLCLDIDMSLPLPGLRFGVWRSPLRTASDTRPVIERIQASKGVHLDGIMGYEAQIAGVGDNFSGQALKNRLVRMLKDRSAGGGRAAARRGRRAGAFAGLRVALRQRRWHRQHADHRSGGCSDGDHGWLWLSTAPGCSITIRNSTTSQRRRMRSRLLDAQLMASIPV